MGLYRIHSWESFLIVCSLFASLIKQGCVLLLLYLFGYAWFSSLLILIKPRMEYTTKASLRRLKWSPRRYLDVYKSRRGQEALVPSQPPWFGKFKHPCYFLSLFVGKVQERNLKPTPGAFTNLERFPNPNLDGVSSDLMKAISGINSGTRG